MDYEFFQIQDAANWLMSLGAAPFTFAAVIIIGYVFRIIPIFPNRFIPGICMLAGPLVFVLLNPHPSSEPSKIFYTHSIIGGLFIAVSAWLVHDKFISRWEDKLKFRFPGADAVLTDTGCDGSKSSFLGKSAGTPAPAPGQAFPDRRGEKQKFGK
jgi:hypothetical protein